MIKLVRTRFLFFITGRSSQRGWVTLCSMARGISFPSYMCKPGYTQKTRKHSVVMIHKQRVCVIECAGMVRAFLATMYGLEDDSFARNCVGHVWSTRHAAAGEVAQCYSCFLGGHLLGLRQFVPVAL